MSDADENVVPEGTFPTTPGVPMQNGEPFVPPPEDPASQSVEENAPENATQAQTPSPAPETQTAPTPVLSHPGAIFRKSPSSARDLAKKALDSAGIKTLRVLADWDTVTVELEGKVMDYDPVVVAVSIPGVFTLEGANKGPSVVKFRHMPDGLGGIARTVITLNRRLVPKAEK